MPIRNLIFHSLLALSMRCQVACLLLAYLFCSSGWALTIAIIPKSSDDINQIAVAAGCNKLAVSNGDYCDLITVGSEFQPRMQVYAINTIRDAGNYDAIAISVTDSTMLARVLEDVSVPIVTFDSDFSEAHQTIRKSYIGIDNYQIGADLAQQAMALLPEGGSVCFMTASYNENLSRRLAGARHTFANIGREQPVSRLTGQNKWSESQRCPWNSGDDIERALHQLEITLGSVKPDMFVAVGDWAFRRTDDYKAVLRPYQQQIQSGRTMILTAMGAYSSAHAGLINESLLHGVVSIDFELMGKQVYKTLKVLTEQGEVDDVIHVGHLTVTADNHKIAH